MRTLAQRLAASTSIFAVALLAMPGMAAAQTVDQEPGVNEQNRPTDASPDGQVEEDDEAIVVTGSRIARPNYDTVEPVIVVGSEDIESRGFSTIGQALSEQPAFGVPGATPIGGQSSFGPGQNFVDFFSLGSQRTLTLVNSRRFVGSNNSSIFGPTGSGGSQVDLNIIPTKLVQRIETIAVGGAPIYGSDAIAGTVNVILRRDYEGIELDGQYGISERGDAADYRVRAIAGTNFADDRGNIVFTAEYNKSDGLLATDRGLTSSGDFFARSNTPGDTISRRIFADRRIPSISEAGIPTVGGAAFGLDFPLSPAQAALFIGDPTLNFGVNGPDGVSQLRFDANGNLIPIDFGTATGLPSQFNIDFSGGNGFSLVPLTNLLSELERINGVGLATFELTDNVRVFAEGWYSRSTGTNLRDQPEYNTGLFGAAGDPSGSFILSLDNPFLTAAQRATIQASINNNPLSDLNFLGEDQDYFYLGRANTDLVSGRSRGKVEVYRGVLGLDGKFELNGRELNWEVVGNYGRSKTSARNTALATQNLFNALDAVRDASGNIVCRSGAPATPAPTISSTCAPLNPFGIGQASQAARDYVTAIADPEALNEQAVGTVSIAGPIARLPGGNLSIALGYEHRYESQKFDPGEYFLGGADNTPLVDENGDGNPNNDPSPFGQSVPIVGIDENFNTDEVFGEVTADLIGPDQNIPLIRALEFKAAGRYVDNSLSGGDFTWTAGGRWEPLRGLTFRGNYTRAIRSPSITEASNPSQSFFGFATDPCDSSQVANGPDPATRRANCIAAGINPDTFTSLSDQRSFPGAVAGDPLLSAEKSDSFTVGALFRPRFLPGFNASVDYVDIKIKDVISDFSADQTLNACYDSTDFPNNPFCDRISREANGQLDFVLTGYANQAELRYKGIIANVAYNFNTPFLGADSRLGFAVDYQYLDTLSSRAGEGAATNSVGNIGLAQHKILGRITYDNGPFNGLISASYFGPGRFDVNEADTFRTPNRVEDVVFVNASMAYDIDERFQFRVVVDNIFDQDPPFPSPTGGGTLTYFRGILGRYFRFGAAVRF